MIKPIILGVGIFSLGVLLGFILARHPHGDAPDANTALVFKALTKASSANIPNNQCEFNGTSAAKKGSAVRNGVTVGDFISSYLNWSFNSGRTSNRSLTCKGSGTLQCEWTFGEDKYEGWDRILRFQYNEKSQLIEPKSLVCIDVP
jgi:hypothetical protein